MLVTSLRRSVWMLATSALLFAGTLQAAATEGREYSRLASPQTPETQDKTEVLEFFSWGCPHCYHFHPLLDEWAARLPPNVKLVRIPVSMGHPQWGQLVRAYYTLEATGDLARLDGALFDAIHKERQQLYNEDNLARWAVSQGINEAKFRQTFNSFNVSTRASHAEQMSRDYQVQGIPQLVVAGKYVVLGNDFKQMLVNATQVIELAAKEGG
jgi:thiol:disulfide interchange protein DsbA